MNRLQTAGLLTGLTVVLLAGCGKASETAIEKVIEHQAAKDGVQAKVDLQGGQTRITATDAQGQTSQLQAGGVALSEADLGVPIYPGASLDPATSSRVDSPGGNMVMAQLRSADPADKVAAFYRAKLQAQASGKQFIDNSGGDGGTSMMLVDDAAKTMVQVMVGKEDSGSSVQITHSRGANTP